MGEEGEGRGPLRPEYIRLIKIAIVAVIVIAALVITVPILQDALRQPRVTLIETSASFVGCGLFGSSQTYTFFFTLVNSGDAAAFANVQFHLSGVNSANENYFIPAGSSVAKSADVRVNDCVERTFNIVLAAFWKA